MFALFVNSDSTELHVISIDRYGYLTKGQTAGDFTLTPLADSIHFVNNAHISDYIPYFADDKCFMGNADGTRIYIYNIAAGSWNKIGELSIWDFLTDTPEYKEHIGRSHRLNLSNHITRAGGSQYYVTTEQRRILTGAQYGTLYKHFLISLNESDSSGFNLIFQTSGFNVEVDVSEIFSSCYIEELFLQDNIFTPVTHVILSNDSPQYIQGSCNYPIRDRFFFEDYLIGMGDGVVMKSYDSGVNWEEWVNINGAWSYSFIGRKHVVYNANNIAHWKLEESYESTQMLESNALLGIKIHYLKEFDGYVYTATNMGLYKKPLNAFFTPRPESKSINHPIIERR